MKRTKEWWGKFSEYERSYICWIERIKGYYSKFGFWPNEKHECNVCYDRNYPGICPKCLDKYKTILKEKK
jgi:hypothetical protein